MNVLLTCPFCGSVRITLFEGAIGGSYAAAMCQDCHATGPEGVTREEALSLWNRRDGRDNESTER